MRAGTRLESHGGRTSQKPDAEVAPAAAATHASAVGGTACQATGRIVRWRVRVVVRGTVTDQLLESDGQGREVIAES